MTPAFSLFLSCPFHFRMFYAAVLSGLCMVKIGRAIFISLSGNIHNHNHKRVTARGPEPSELLGKSRQGRTHFCREHREVALALQPKVT